MDINQISASSFMNTNFRKSVSQKGFVADSIRMDNEIQNNSLNEILGRAQVTFCGKVQEDSNLVEADVNFVNALGGILRLEDEGIKYLEQATKLLLDETGKKALSELKSEDFTEYANEEACYVENISKKFNLSDYESTALDWLLTSQVDSGDITKIGTRFGRTLVDDHKFLLDYTPCEAIIGKYSHSNDDLAINTSITVLEKIADIYELDSVFDLFNSENIEEGRDAISMIAPMLHIDENEKADMILDFYTNSSKTREERLAGINIHKMSEGFEDGMCTLVIANQLSNEFGIPISKDLLDMLDQRVTANELHSGGKSQMEVAYRIAEKYNLPSNAENKIVEILNEFMKPSLENNFIENLIDTLNGSDINN